MTSVQWLIEQLYQHEYHIDILDVATINGYFEQAKEMHKKEIIDAIEEEVFHSTDKTAEQYYNETFNK